MQVDDAVVPDAIESPKVEMLLMCTSGYYGHMFSTCQGGIVINIEDRGKYSKPYLCPRCASEIWIIKHPHLTKWSAMVESGKHTIEEYITKAGTEQQDITTEKEVKKTAQLAHEKAQRDRYLAAQAQAKADREAYNKKYGIT